MDTPTGSPDMNDSAMNTAGMIATYDSHDQVEDAVRELHRAGFNMKRLSIIGKGYHSEEHPIGFYTAGDRMKTWGGVGAFWGALWGMLFGAALFWIPGIGLLGAAGPFVHVLAGALEGAALLGGASVLGAALATIGVPRDSILKYERSLRADRYLLIVHGTREEIGMAREIAGRTGAAETGAFDNGVENAAGRADTPG
jgi:hypothetical protein